jgi:hypothetical protein
MFCNSKTPIQSFLNPKYISKYPRKHRQSAVRRGEDVIFIEKKSKKILPVAKHFPILATNLRGRAIAR